MKILFKAGMVSGLALMATIATSSVNDAAACGPDAYVGTICITGASFCPRDFRPLNGALYSINEYTMTYAVTGLTYGGDGQTSFGVPDARGRELVHEGTGPGLKTIQAGEYTGFESATIPFYYFPAHTHDLDFTQAAATATANLYANPKSADKFGPGDNYFADTTLSGMNYTSTADKYTAAGSITATASVGTGTMGVTGTTPQTQAQISAIGPQLGLLFCVALDGIYPPRS